MSKFANLSDRQFCKQVTAEALRVLEEHFEDLGVAVTRGNASYEAGSFRTKFTFAKVRADGVVMTPERRDFIDRIEWRETTLTADDIDAEFISGGKLFKIVGLKTRASKRPILCEGEDGKSYVFPIKAVERGLAEVR